MNRIPEKCICQLRKAHLYLQHFCQESTTIFPNLLSGYQPCKWWVTNQHLGDLVCPHHFSQCGKEPKVVAGHRKSLIAVFRPSKLRAWVDFDESVHCTTPNVICINICESRVHCSWNDMAHVQKPYFILSMNWINSCNSSRVTSKTTTGS